MRIPHTSCWCRCRPTPPCTRRLSPGPLVRYAAPAAQTGDQHSDRPLPATWILQARLFRVSWSKTAPRLQPPIRDPVGRATAEHDLVLFRLLLDLRSRLTLAATGGGLIRGKTVGSVTSISRRGLARRSSSAWSPWGAIMWCAICRTVPGTPKGIRRRKPDCVRPAAGRVG